MPTDEMIIRLFCIVADTLSDDNKRADAHVYPSEIGTIGLLFALKGGRFRRFHRWLQAHYGSCFPKLPERSRFQRLGRDYRQLAADVLVAPTFFTIIATYGIELRHPRRAGRSATQRGRTGQSKGRWISGVNLAWLVDAWGRVVHWIWDTADAPDQDFRDRAFAYAEQAIVLAAWGGVRGTPPTATGNTVSVGDGMNATSLRRALAFLKTSAIPRRYSIASKAICQLGFGTLPPS